MPSTALRSEPATLAVERTDPVCGATTDVVVFLHGLGGNGMVHYLLQQQVKDRFTTVSVDFSGLGRSAARAVPSFGQWIDDARKAIPAEAVRLLVVGHSMGSLVARHLAAEDPRVRGLVLYGPVLAPDESTRGIFLDRAGDALAEGMVHVADRFGLGGISQETRLRSSLPALIVRNFLMSQIPERYAEASKAMSEAWEPSNPPLSLATATVVHGLDDPISTPAVAQQVVSAMAGGNVRVIGLPATGHWPTIEQPQPSIDALEETLAATFVDASTHEG
ncbi:alpha/beta hydrolase [Arthrobacter sp. I2-34]|uniref:Alpha/beta hydrolase n=1 Tax=Arthrobacter hankyongi TaxID=2904801 RepID=A0ABS9LE36_9MICC|nr:alpha/beta hydrolase [Arthrobacter hankyongi]MCG2624719.1 alpha/beta hydrolase [Arthrobacter hankyongi]